MNTDSRIQILERARRHSPRHRVAAAVLAIGVGAAGCHRAPALAGSEARGVVRPGITVLLSDSLALVRGKRLALLTNQTGVDAQGTSDIELLRGDRARAAGVTLVRLFSPEHGIRGTEDRQHIASGIDERSGLPVISLYTSTAIAPPDSVLRDLDALVLDLQDVGTRTWTYVGSMVYALRACARRNLPLIVLDRPNPITGVHVDGPMLDTALSNANEQTAQRAAKPYALYPFPLRHGMTMGELALFYNSVLGIHARLHVVPAAGWRRSMWLDETGLPWVKPSPNLATLTSVLLYPSLVPFEGSNLSVGRGTSTPFVRFGAPWLDAPRIVQALEARRIPGVRFVVEAFTPVNPGDGKYGGRTIPGVRIDVTNRDAVRSGRLAAELLAALVAVHRDSLRIDTGAFDERFGSTAARDALMHGADPLDVMRRQQPAVDAFLARARAYRLYP